MERLKGVIASRPAPFDGACPEWAEGLGRGRRGNLTLRKVRLPPLGGPRGRLCPLRCSGLLAMTGASGGGP